ncbi:hypothetical protein [Methanobrevibacter oralis]|nr:hypothetical protein [Methanobrevibacter oralis]
MDKNIRNNEKIKIKKISIENIGIKDLLNPEFLDKLESNFDDFSLITLALTIGGDKPSNLISLGHTSSDDFKNDILTINAETEANLYKFLDLL